MTTSAATFILSEFALRKVDELPQDEQIEIYRALSVTLPDKSDRMLARNLAVSISRVSALQLELTLSRKEPQDPKSITTSDRDASNQ